MKRCELNGCALPERIRKSRDREARRKAERDAIAMKEAAKELAKNSRARAKVIGVECRLTAADIEEMLVASGGRCAVSGAPLNYGHGNGRRRPWFPSVDRRDCRYGYVRGNTRIVCVAVNLAMNEWGEDVLHRIAWYLIRKLAATDPNGKKKAGVARFARDRKLKFSHLSPMEPENPPLADAILLTTNE